MLFDISPLVIQYLAAIGTLCRLIGDDDILVSDPLHATYVGRTVRPWSELYFPLRALLPAATVTAFLCLDATVVRPLQMNMERAALRGRSECVSE